MSLSFLCNIYATIDSGKTPYEQDYIHCMFTIGSKTVNFVIIIIQLPKMLQEC